MATRAEFVLNTLMIVPVSLLGGLIWPRLSWRDRVAIGFDVAAGVELIQGPLLPDRSATFADIVANTLGTALGAVVVTAARRGAARLLARGGG